MILYKASTKCWCLGEAQDQNVTVRRHGKAGRFRQVVHIDKRSLDLLERCERRLCRHVQRFQP